MNHLDPENRQRALDPAHSYIVQAPAGSGKTELLSQRILTLLSWVDYPEEILAITFTQKAAAEMRHRVMHALHEAASDQAEPSTLDPHKAQTLNLARAVVERHQQRQWFLLEQPQRLRIMTFDAFASLLAKQHPMRSGGGGRIEAEPHALYERAARATVDALDDDDSPHAVLVEHALRVFDNHPNALVKDLCALLERRDQWLDLPNQDFVAFCQRLCETRCQHLQQQFQQSGLWAAAWALLSATALISEDAANETPWSRETCQALLGLFLTKEGSWRKAFSKKEGCPPKSAAKAAAEAWLLALEDHPQSESQRESLRHSLLDVAILPQISDGESLNIQAFLALMQQCERELQKQFASHGAVDFIEQGRRARRVLGDEHAPSSLALRLDYRLQHLLIDEFQDTSISQFKLMEQLVAGWQAGDGRSLFLVGDPMQSIYRFRQADVGLFIQAWSRGLGGVPLQALRLSRNFRSAKAIVDWVNLAFSGIFPPANDWLRGAVSLALAESTRPDPVGAGVFRHPIADRETEAAKMVELIQQTDPAQRIAILVRARTHIPAIEHALRKAGLAYRSIEMDALSTRPAVLELHSLTRYLLQPHDRLAYFSLLRMVGVPLVDVAALSQYLEAQNADQSGAFIDTPLPELQDVSWVLRVQQTLQEARRLAHRLGLRDRVEQAWVKLGGWARHADSRDDVSSYLDWLEAQKDHNFWRLEQGLQRLKANRNQPEARIEIMTLFKAKGLEFDVVLLAGLDKPPRHDEDRLLRWSEVNSQQQRQFLLAAKPEQGQESSTYQWLKTLDKQRNEAETQRFLYVAATRAKQQLHLLAVPPKVKKDGEQTPKAGSLLNALWPAVADDFSVVLTSQPDDGPDDPAEETPPAFAPQRWPLPRHWQPTFAETVDHHSERITNPSVEAEAERVDFDWAGRNARVAGLAVHRWVQRVAHHADAAHRLATLPLALVQQGLEQAGLQGEDLREYGQIVHTALRRFGTEEIGQWILSPQHQDRHHEWALSYQQGGQLLRRQIDCSFIDEAGTRWIIDIKVGRHDGHDLDSFFDNERVRYQQQLAEYRQILQRKEQRPIRLALYFPLYGGWRAWG